MQISELRAEVSERLGAFAWNEWAQMGVLAEPRQASRWAADPEALLVFTLQIGRDDPRMLDEVLDWTAKSAVWISAQRLWNQAASNEDGRLIASAVGWANDNGARLGAKRELPRQDRQLERLFYGLGEPSTLDPAFTRHGFARPPVSRSGKSRAPDLGQPINFAFRLRHVFGVGTRSEAMRFLLTASAASPTGRHLFTTLAIAEAAGYQKRPVQDALSALAEADAIEAVRRGNERLYSVDLDRWRALLPHDENFPLYRNWPQILLAAREIHRWLSDAANASLSPYLLGSEARAKLHGLLPSLLDARLPVSDPKGLGADYWPGFVEVVRQLLAGIESDLPW